MATYHKDILVKVKKFIKGIAANFGIKNLREDKLNFDTCVLIENNENMIAPNPVACPSKAQWKWTIRKASNVYFLYTMNAHTMNQGLEVSIYCQMSFYKGCNAIVIETFNCKDLTVFVRTNTTAYSKYQLFHAIEIKIQSDDTSYMNRKKKIVPKQGNGYPW